MLYFMSQRVERQEELKRVLPVLSTHLETVAMTMAGEVTFLRAGLVNFGGRNLLFTDSSEHSLAELSTAFEELGAKVLSEQLVGVLPSGEVQIFPEKREPIKVDLVGIVGGPSSPTADEAEAVTAGQASLHLFARALNARTRTPEALRTLSNLATKTKPVACSAGTVRTIAKNLKAQVAHAQVARTR